MADWIEESCRHTVSKEKESSRAMRICLIATEFPGLGPSGGFGYLTREIAAGLFSRGIEVYIAMPRKPDQKPVSTIDGLTIISYPSPLYYGLRKVLHYAEIFKMIDADIYHSEEPSLGTRLAQIGAPHKKHIVTFQDPRTFQERGEDRSERDHRVSKIAILKSKARFAINYSQVIRAVRKADALYCQAWYAIPKTMKLYRLRKVPVFLPNPVRIPERDMEKAEKPTVCYLGRWDPRKRPEYFFELAKRFPNVEFISMGASHSPHSKREEELRDKFQSTPNLRMTGWAEGDVKSKMLEHSWILVNTSWRECLPVSFLEACAHRCAILSHENADDFACKFGCWAQQGDIDDFSRGLNFLLENDRWRECGNRGYEYVKTTHEFGKVIDEHIAAYKKLAPEEKGTLAA